MPQIHVNCALYDTFLQFGMILGMGMRFPKTTASKVGWPPGGRYAQYSKWPPLEYGNTIYKHLLFACIMYYHRR